MAFTTFTSGIDTSFSTELNNNFKYCGRYINQNITGYTATASTETSLTTYSIASSIPKNGVKITFSVYCTASATNKSCTFKVYLGGTLKRTVTISNDQTGGSVTSTSNYKTFIVYDIVENYASNVTLEIKAYTLDGLFTTAGLTEFYIETV